MIKVTQLLYDNSKICAILHNFSANTNITTQIHLSIKQRIVTLI